MVVNVAVFLARLSGFLGHERLQNIKTFLGFSVIEITHAQFPPCQLYTKSVTTNLFIRGEVIGDLMPF